MSYEIVETALADGFCISDDPARIDAAFVHDFLASHAYWAAGRDRAVTLAAIAGSHCFGVYGREGQAGFARVVTDHALFAWIGDVFILPSLRGRGLGQALVRAIVEHPNLSGVRRMMLVTRDAHGLYQQFGFTSLHEPGGYMVRQTAAAAVDVST